MISADTNIFVHAANRSSALCPGAMAFFASHATDTEFVLCELVLIELYMCLRNPAILKAPLDANAAVTYCEALRANRHWQIVDAAPEIRAELWRFAGDSSFPFRRIIDARLALSLKFHGVDAFATINTRDFEKFGFQKLWNPLGPA